MGLGYPPAVALLGISSAFAGIGFSGGSVKPIPNGSGRFAIPKGICGHWPGSNRRAAPAYQPRFIPAHSRHTAASCSGPGTVRPDTHAASRRANGNGYPLAGHSDGYGDPDASVANANNAHRSADTATLAAGHRHPLASPHRNPDPGGYANPRAYAYPQTAAYRRDCSAGGGKYEHR